MLKAPNDCIWWKFGLPGGVVTIHMGDDRRICTLTMNPFSLQNSLPYIFSELGPGSKAKAEA